MTSEDIKELICEDDEKLKQIEETWKKYLAEHPYITEEICEVIKNEFDMNISPYEKLEAIHSNINLYLDEDGIEAGKVKNCRFNFFIKDENETPHDFILECDDVKLEYLEEWK